MSEQPRPMDCQAVDELDAAFALDALSPHDRVSVIAHLETCPQPHVDLRSLLGAGPMLAASLEPVSPRPELRDRVMASVAATPQIRPTVEKAGIRPPPTARPERRGGWLDWLSPGWARGIATVGVAASVVLGALSIGLWGQLAARDTALREAADAIASGAVANLVDGSHGRGYVIDTPGAGSTFVVAGVRGLSGNELYELWLLNAEGVPVDVGTFRPGDEPLVVVQVEEDLSGFTTFAVTVETARVEAPTSDVVMAGALGG
jgi:anti-sigma-K factor RskA